jgi:hypothetical protein
MPGEHPRNPNARLGKRNTITLKAVEDAIRTAIVPYLSIKCRDGDHFRDDPSFGPSGCANDGTTCLCECHDETGNGS